MMTMLGPALLSMITFGVLLVASETPASDAVRYKGTYLCNWLVKLEDFFLCHNDKVRETVPVVTLDTTTKWDVKLHKFVQMGR